MPHTQVYIYQCSKCHRKEKFCTEHTIETHLGADQLFLQSLPQDTADLTGSQTFVESYNNQTIQLLSRTHGGFLLPCTCTAPDAKRSCPEGVQLSFFSHSLTLTLLLLFITLKQSLILQQISRLSRFLGHLNIIVMP
jgi:hypothetical protein